MMINMGETKPVRFGLSGAEEIAQNVRTILGTLQGTVPLSRGLGIDPTFIDEPIPIAKARLTSAIMAAVAEYEPRVIVTEVTFSEEHQTGKLIPVIHIEPREVSG